MNITPLTRQEIFDKALFGIRRQQYRKSRVTDDRGCAYRGADGQTMCGIGHCIPDDLMGHILNVDSSLNGAGVTRLMRCVPEARTLLSTMSTEELISLQNCHDDFTCARDFEQMMEKLAGELRVVYTPPPCDTTIKKEST